MVSLKKYIEALNTEYDNFTSLQKSILKAHYEVFCQKATASQLAAYLGTDYRAINRSYGTFARRVNSFVEPDLYRYPDGYEWQLDGILTAKMNEQKHWVLSLRPHFAEALEVVGRVEVGSSNENAEDLGLDDLDETTAKAVINARVGQGRFRHALLEFWDRCCAVTQMEDTRLLRASHIKPWAVSNNTERLDPSNGLLLSPSLDAAFDAGLISFSNSGKILISEHAVGDLKKLGINSRMVIDGLSKAHNKYLKYHRKEIFEG